METFTPEDLLQYLYNETSPEKTAAIKSAIETDWLLREKLHVIASATKRLDTLHFSPRQQTIDNIMNYAEKAIEQVSHPA